MNMNAMNLEADQSSDSMSITEALVLSCMDHRMIAPVADYLDERGLRGRYDQIVLAGGAIGVMSTETAAWSETFWQHVELASDLHNISKIIVIDHRDCGACKSFVGPTCADEREGETGIHKSWMKALAYEINIRNPNLDVELLLMDLDGTVEIIED